MRFVTLFPEVPADVEIEIERKPISVNHMYGQNGKRRFLTKEGREYRRKLESIVKQKTHLENNNIFVEIVYYFPDRRRRDVTNYEKLILDSLTGHIYDDDRQINEILIRKKIDKKNPRTKIRIWKM